MQSFILKKVSTTGRLAANTLQIVLLCVTLRASAFGYSLKRRGTQGNVEVGMLIKIKPVQFNLE